MDICAKKTVNCVSFIGNKMSEHLKVESLCFYPLENAAEHRTDRFELIHDEDPIPILRRGQLFNVAVRFSNRSVDLNKDFVRLMFNYGNILIC